MPKGDNNRKLTDEQRDEIVRRYTTPLPDGTWVGVTRLASDYGVRHFVIQTHLKKRGVKMRSGKEAWSNGKAARPRKPPSGTPPLCKCGCGTEVLWFHRKKRWYFYAPGHYTQRGKQNPSWLGGTSLLPYSYDWPAVAYKIRKRDNWTCRDCGAKPAKRSGALHVHHIDRDKTNNVGENLVTLCLPCHSRRHVDQLRRTV